MNKKVVVITGSSWWLGRALTEDFLQKWYYVIAGVRNQKGSEREAHENYEVISLDVTSAKDQSKLISRIKEIGRLDVLVNNAAISGWWDFWKRDMSIDRNVYEINLFWPLELVRICHDLLESSKWSVVNISSIAGVVPTPFLASYGASKIALESQTVALYLENPHTKIRYLNLRLWPLTEGLCANKMSKWEHRYKEWVRTHMEKIKHLHGYPVEKVAESIFSFLDSENKFSTKTLGTWAKTIVFLAKLLPQPWYQVRIGKWYKKISF